MSVAIDCHSITEAHSNFLILLMWKGHFESPVTATAAPQLQQVGPRMLMVQGQVEAA